MVARLGLGGKRRGGELGLGNHTGEPKAVSQAFAAGRDLLLLTQRRKDAETQREIVS